ncbi:hypothetical protein [Pseudomonas fluorescens]|uniref:hypothetical protein n=1 Tax=Pseudomonas fluorescens TaxID=294 RepID=UPI00177ECF0B|nr:hypothetical protein [Pseudomonas fluorescens]
MLSAFCLKKFDQTVGASLFAIAVDQSTEMLNVKSHRQQAGSHKLSVFCLKKFDQTVGASLLAKAVDQSTEMLNVTTPSPAGWLLQVVRIPPEETRSTCGSWLASDSGRPASIYVERAAAIAGKPAPTGFCVWQKSMKIPPPNFH